MRRCARIAATWIGLLALKLSRLLKNLKISAIHRKERTVRVRTPSSESGDVGVTRPSLI